MRTEFQQGITTHLPSEERSSAGDRLEAGLAADQAHRASVSAQWELRIGRVARARTKLREGMRPALITTALIATLAAPWALDQRSSLIHDGNPLLWAVPWIAGAAFALTLWGGLLLHWSLGVSEDRLRAAARRAGVEIGPDVLD